jgi:NTE family protein
MEKSLNDKLKIGIALGGGGARGFAHIGVLKVLEDAGIRPDIIVGTSMGSVVGASYSCLLNADAVEDHFKKQLKDGGSAAQELNVYTENQKGDHFFDHVSQEIKQRIVINLSISRRALMSADRLAKGVASLIDDVRIEDLPVTFAAMASDLRTGKGVIIRRGSLRKAVIASSSIPGFFPPVEMDSFLLIDGEATDLIPVTACRILGADFIIAVDVRRNLEPMPELRHTIDIFIRSATITGYRYAETTLKSADFILHPISEDIHWSEFERLNELVATGEWETRARLSDLKGKLQHHRKKASEDEFDYRNTHILLS